jgi:hypothetical protein
LTLNADGSFVYTPDQALRATGGDDMFRYSAFQSALGFGSPFVTVKIYVIRLRLTIGGLNHSSNMSVGTSVIVNANNDNGSPVTSTIPQRRDLELSPLRDFATGTLKDDDDLVAVEQSISPTDWELRGIVDVKVIENGTGKIKLWREKSKQESAETVFLFRESLPNTFFIEGNRPSSIWRDCVIVVNYWFFGGAAMPKALIRDKLAVTVTPIIERFTISPGKISFSTDSNGSPVIKAAGPPQMAGAVFLADVVALGGGEPRFIQNMLGVDNGAGGGLIYTAASGRPNLNLGITGGTFPLLDRFLPVQPPSNDPYYDGDFHFLPPNGNTISVSATDSPHVLLPNRIDLESINITMRLRLHLAWRFDDGVSFSFAYREWSVEFLADTYVNGQGVTRVVVTNVPAPGNLILSVEQPVVSGPTFNDRNRLL